MKKLKAVLFDVDGVLLDSTAANVAFYCELFRRIGGFGLTDEEMMKHKHLSVDGMLRKHYPEATDEQILTWAKLADEIDAGFDLLKPMPGVAEVIPQLATQYKLGLVTNRRTSGVEELWQVVQLQQYFPVIASFEKTANHKPDPEPIRYALKELNIEPSEAVFVGDAQTDLQAGQAAGVDAIIYGPESWPGAIATTQDFSDLPKIINKMSSLV